MKTSALLIGITVTAACAARHPMAGTPASEPISPGVATSTFDSLWSVVHNTYVDTAFVASRWMAVKDTLRPRAALVNTRGELESLLTTMLKRIPDSHFYIIPAQAEISDNAVDAGEIGGTTGLSLRAAGDKALAWRVEPGSPAAKSGITPGESIEIVGSRDVRAALRKVAQLPIAARPRALSEVLFSLNHALAPAPGASVQTLIGPVSGGKAAEHVLVAVPATGTVAQFGNLPPLAANVSVTRLGGAPGTGPGSCVGLIAFNIWLPSMMPTLERSMDQVSDCKGIVVDLRGNPGGVGAMVMGFGGYFVDSAISLGTMKSRSVSLRFVMNPRRVKSDGSPASPFRGPLAILVDPMTASTSEIFATGMQRIGRARVFGERSAAAALPAMMDRLPSGDVFVHAVADFTDPEGKRIEGAGVVPDEVIPLSAKELSEGRDTALEAATRWIRGSSAATRTPAG